MGERQGGGEVSVLSGIFCCPGVQDCSNRRVPDSGLLHDQRPKELSAPQSVGHGVCLPVQIGASRACACALLTDRDMLSRARHLTQDIVVLQQQKLIVYKVDMAMLLMSCKAVGSLTPSLLCVFHFGGDAFLQDLLATLSSTVLQLSHKVRLLSS